MAARQDQTLQIFLIVFIFLTLALAVGTYLGWRGYSEAEQRAANLQSALNEKTTQIQTQQTTIEDHQEHMGFGRSDSPESVKTAFEADMKAYNPGVSPEGSGSYRKALEAVYNDAQNAAAREAKLKEQLSELTKAMQALQGQKAAEIAKIEEARTKAQSDLAAAQNSFLQDREKMKKSETSLMATVESQKNEFEAKLAQFQTEKAALEKEIGKLADANEILKSQRKDEPGSFEFADGRISWVNQNGTVWINLGSADSLRRQVTFSVYDADQHDAAKATKKGSIEVTRVLGPHMAEAKVTEDDAKNPILTGDNIYSQVWHRGKQLHFALTGFIDIDGDGRSDMPLARELIAMNDGIVDAYLNDDGTVEGEITANTRYLVLGDIPESATQVKLQTGFHSMSTEASKLGVESITLAEFLGQMGYKPQDRTVQLGEGATARDFPARPEDESAPVSAPRFRARTPYRAPAPALPPQ
ncbi:MAG: hypothetical protein L0228_08920 [Planctomycetes bacterium]|nr:hypothetical protein [Planctomycetota bacterium]